MTSLVNIIRVLRVIYLYFISVYKTVMTCVVNTSNLLKLETAIAFTRFLKKKKKENEKQYLLKHEWDAVEGVIFLVPSKKENISLTLPSSRPQSYPRISSYLLFTYCSNKNEIQISLSWKNYQGKPDIQRDSKVLYYLTQSKLWSRMRIKDTLTVTMSSFDETQII